ncbi:PST family polysaccharide transporter/lipopolysaccharide exporter [Pedobacter sp. AK017]|nr:PST family polysaccharide transporter/lipopolysaccharide exporter [Pedobacter sp. AK017]
MVGILMFIVIYFTAPLLVLYYKEPELAEILRLAAFYFPIVFLGQIYNILLEKELQFKSLALTEIICSVLGTSITIYFAYQGYQAKALIFGLLSAQFLKMIIQNIIARKYFFPSIHFDLSKIKEHLRFGIFNIGESVISFANNNLDTIFIGGFLDVKQLGYYTIASQIAVYPVSRLCPIIIQICYPIMAKIKDNLGQLKNAYLKIIDFLTFCNIPLLVGLFLMAENVVPLIYGPGWEPTVPLIKIFIFMGIFSCLVYPLSTVAYSTGKPNLLFYLSLVMLVLKFPIIYFASNYGILGIAVGFLITSFIAVILNFILIQRMLGSFMKPFLENLSKPIMFSLSMVVVILLYRQFIGNLGLVHTVIQIALGGAVYGVLTLKYKISFSELKSLRSSL